MKLTLKQKNEIRSRGQRIALLYKFNIFQLAKRVRRADRESKGARIVIDRETNPATQTSDLTERNLRLAYAGHHLKHAQQTFRVAIYYLTAHNVSAGAPVAA